MDKPSVNEKWSQEMLKLELYDDVMKGEEIVARCFEGGSLRWRRFWLIMQEGARDLLSSQSGCPFEKS